MATLPRIEILLAGALVVQTQTTKLAGLPAVTSATDGNDWTRTHSWGVFGVGGLDVVLGVGLGLGEGLGLVLGLELGLELVLEPGLELGGGLELGLLVSDGLAGGVLVEVSDGAGLGELVSDGLALDVVLLVSVGVTDVESADDEVVVVLAAVRRTVAEVTTEAVDGTEAHGEVAALVAAWTASAPKIIIPTPKKASPKIAPSATGLSSSALTRCNLASASGPGTTFVVRLRHSTHGSLSSSRGLAMDSKDSRSCRLGH